MNELRIQSRNWVKYLYLERLELGAFHVHYYIHMKDNICFSTSHPGSSNLIHEDNFGYKNHSSFFPTSNIVH